MRLRHMMGGRIPTELNRVGDVTSYIDARPSSSPAVTGADHSIHSGCRRVPERERPHEPPQQQAGPTSAVFFACRQMDEPWLLLWHGGVPAFGAGSGVGVRCGTPHDARDRTATFRSATCARLPGKSKRSLLTERIVAMVSTAWGDCAIAGSRHRPLRVDGVYDILPHARDRRAGSPGTRRSSSGDVVWLVMREAGRATWRRSARRARTGSLRWDRAG